MLPENILKGSLKKLAFFDFCETLVSFQTADAFVDYVRKKDGTPRMLWLDKLLSILIKFRIIAVFNKLSPNATLGKNLKLLQLRGFSYAKLDQLAALYYQEMIKPNLIKPLIAEMQRLAQLDYEIILVSAGYSIYLKYFAADYQITNILSSEIAFKKPGNLCSGIILGKDCIRAEKVKRIDVFFAFQHIDYSECISYSDSISDLPMLQLTGKGVVVSRNQTQAWSHENNLKEIIWN